jgi:hypothetical protein
LAFERGSIAGTGDLADGDNCEGHARCVQGVLQSDGR